MVTTFALGEVERPAVVRTDDEDRFPIVVADMASLASVAEAVDRIRSSEARLDVIVDNAGGIFPERTESPDGIEATLATMVVGPFALIAGLLPLLRRTGRARVIAVTSGGMYAQALPLDDLQMRSGPFDGTRAYARAKRAQVAMMREWARRVPSSEVTFTAMHPGWADTPGLDASLPGFARLMRPILRSAAEGVDTIIWLATARSGQIAPLRPDPEHAAVRRGSCGPVARHRRPGRGGRPRPDPIRRRGGSPPRHTNRALRTSHDPPA